jgi:hypothetical protein
MGPFLKWFLRKLAKVLIVLAAAYVLFLIVFFAVCRFSKPDISVISEDSDLVAHPRPVVVADFGANHRPLEETYYSYPEWFIVWSYEERANFLEKSRLPSDFPYFGSIYQYWHGYCFICSLTHQRKQPNFGDQLALVVLGSSFSLEYAIRGAYENTIGRLSESVSGNQLTDEDAYAARVARDYANFVNVRPFYEFHFARALKGLWTDTSFWGPHALRKCERKGIFTLDYGLQAIYAEILQLASHLTYGAESTETWATIDNASESLFREFPHIRKVNELGHGSYLVSIPRYQEFTELAIALAKKDVHFQQIAGNPVIVVTAIAQKWRDYTPEERPLFTEKLLTRDVERVAMECRVSDLHLVLNDIAARGYLVEHVYDY